MSFLFAKDLKQPQLGFVPSEKPATGFLENFDAAYEETIIAGSSDSRVTTMRRTLQPLVDALNEDSEGTRFENPIGRGGQQDNLERLFAEVERRRQIDKTALPGLPGSMDDFLGAVRERVRRAVDDREDIAARQTTGGAIGAFLGDANAALKDPVNILFLGLGAGPSAGIARRILIEAVANASAEAATYDAVAGFREEAGRPFQDGEFLRRVAFGAVLGGAFGGVVGGAVPAVRAARKLGGLTRRQLLERQKSAVPDPGPEVRGAAQALEREAEIADDNPGAPGPASEAAHADAVEAAVRAAVEQQPLAADAAPEGVVPFDPTGGVRPGRNAIHELDPSTIETDARAFQFKTGGDADGVTDRLRGVKQWDAGRAGVAYVWQSKSGGNFIADGHQRLGLARRLQAEGQDVVMRAYVFREVDGWTPDHLRVIAALKNIGEGTGTATDAAKILRGQPELINDAALPPQSALVRQARQLVNLGDDAFMAVVNDVVPARFAAIVGDLVPDDPDLQRAIIDVLAHGEPANMVQAESMVRQAIAAGAAQERQVTLFGEEMVTTSLFTERAKVLDRAIRELRRDRQVFSTLVREEDRIAASGQAIDAQASGALAATADMAIRQLQVLANRSGGLSDALSAAARRARDDGRLTGAVRDFVEAVRGAVARGDLDGASLGRDGGSGAAAGQDGAGQGGAGQSGPGPGAARSGAEQELEGFDTPDSTGPVSQSRALRATVEQDLERRAAETVAAEQLQQVSTEEFISSQAGFTLDRIYSGATARQGALEEAGDWIRVDVPGVRFVSNGLKDRAAAAAKISRKGYVDASQLTDIVRAGFVVSRPAQAEKVVQGLAQRFDILDEGWSATPAGYFDRKVLIRFPDGEIGEVQIWPDKVLAAKKAKGHQLYRQAREETDPGRLMELEQQQRDVYSAATASLSPDWAGIVEVSASGNRAANRSADITDPESATSARLTSSQSRPLASIENARPSSSSTAGRNSQLTNIIDGSSTPDIGTVAADRKMQGRGTGAQDVATDEAEALAAVPVGERVDETGQVVPDARSARELLDEIDAEEAFLKDLDACRSGAEGGDA